MILTITLDDINPQQGIWIYRIQYLDKLFYVQLDRPFEVYTTRGQLDVLQQFLNDTIVVHVKEHLELLGDK